MVIQTKTQVALSPDAVMERLLEPAHAARLLARLDMVDQIEELSRVERDGRVERVLRYRAPTAGKIPGFLARYASKAPAHVSWEQREVWDLKGRSMTYTIVPEVPERWRSYYTNKGGLEVQPAGAGAQVVATLELEVNVFGFKRMIERALEPEVKRLLELQGAAITDELETPQG
jgi:hypothetical protein